MDVRQVGPFTFEIDFSQPLYEQILEQIRSSIAKGEIQLGEKMASVRELARKLKVNPNTVMRAYQELERDGLTEKRRGQGTFVTTSQRRIEQFRSELAQQLIDEFVLKMEDLGYSRKDITMYIGSGKGGGIS